MHDSKLMLLGIIYYTNIISSDTKSIGTPPGTVLHRTYTCSKVTCNVIRLNDVHAFDALHALESHSSALFTDASFVAWWEEKKEARQREKEKERERVRVWESERVCGRGGGGEREEVEDLPLCLIIVSILYYVNYTCMFYIFFGSILYLSREASV